MEQADWVEMVREKLEDGCTLSEALDYVAKESGKSLAALKMAFYRRYPASSHHRNSILTEEEEQCAVVMIMSISHLHLDWTRK